MKYKGIELKEITEPQIFDPPRKMVVWDKETTTPFLKLVFAISTRTYFPVIAENTDFNHCAEIPDEPKSKLATILQVAEWLAKGNGQMKRKDGRFAFSYCDYELTIEQNLACDLQVRKWDDTEWRKPTREYLGLEDK